jgi:hypothetical protein
MAQPFVEWECSENERLQEERKRLQSERKTLEVRIEALRKKAARSLSDPSLVTQIADLESALPEIPALPRLWVQDVTPEKLAVMMAEQGERIALLSDEGGVFDLLAGLYSKGIPNLDLFLQAHSGSGVRVDRGSRPPVLMQQSAPASWGSSPDGTYKTLPVRSSVERAALRYPWHRGLPVATIAHSAERTRKQEVRRR